MSKNKEVSTRVEQDINKQLAEAYPSEPMAQRINLPRIDYVSQDKTEGKGKSMKVVVEAGTFFTNSATDEKDEEGKTVYEKKEIGTSFEGIILYQRKQLRYYDESTNEFINTPVYDNDDEVLPLWRSKKEIAKGTPAELKEPYKYEDKDGKTKCRLEDVRILYIEYDGEIYQLSLRGSSMWAFKKFATGTIPNQYWTRFSSESKENGAISWNQMTFTAFKELTLEEKQDVLNKIKVIQNTIMAEKSQFMKTVEASDKADEELDALVADATKRLK
jgi:hypothetical protein